jgi:hypothetical protein
VVIAEVDGSIAHRCLCMWSRRVHRGCCCNSCSSSPDRPKLHRFLSPNRFTFISVALHPSSLFGVCHLSDLGLGDTTAGPKGLCSDQPRLIKAATSYPLPTPCMTLFPSYVQCACTLPQNGCCSPSSPAAGSIGTAARNGICQPKLPEKPPKTWFKPSTQCVHLWLGSH